MREPLSGIAPLGRGFFYPYFYPLQALTVNNYRSLIRVFYIIQYIIYLIKFRLSHILKT